MNASCHLTLGCTFDAHEASDHPCGKEVTA